MKLTLTLADDRDRQSIYAIRHDVYAEELRQHPPNSNGQLRDPLDALNIYLVAKRGDQLAGFVAITPPNEHGYSLDKYFSREQVPVVFDQSLYEVRLLTVVRRFRGTTIAPLLMYGALRYVESAGGRTIAVIGRVDVLDIYKRAGLIPRGLQVRSGQVTYELMTASVSELRGALRGFDATVAKLERTVEWDLPKPEPKRCEHGGAFFRVIGEEFEALDKKTRIISADVLDAWFDPAPAVLRKLADHLSFAVKTSPPVDSDGMRRTIAGVRDVDESCVLPAAGSSPLIFAGLSRWVARSSRVLILDPTYGEYAHVLHQLAGAAIERLKLSPDDGYAVDIEYLRDKTRAGFDWVVLVNPNSPTGRHVSRKDLLSVFDAAHPSTRFWIDETYVDYVDPDESVERHAARSHNVVVCKSLSKAYALSGVRAAYLCGPAAMIGDLAQVCPPWAVSLPAQIAACEALKAMDYYRQRWAETRQLRQELGAALEELGWTVVPGVANFLMCRLPSSGPPASAVVATARRWGLFIRDVRAMGSGSDARVVRVAVKDRHTNGAMVDIIRRTLAALAQSAAAID